MKIFLLIIRLLTVVNDANEVDINHDYLDNQIEIMVDNFEIEYKEYQDYLKSRTFNGETAEVIVKKISRYLKSNMKGKGEFIVNYCLDKGLDPYLATSVMLLETGCYWGCSRLTKDCHNYGGNKGKPGCHGGSYRKFDTQEEGMTYAMKVLNKYYQSGKTTPKEINPKYATSKVWYKKVENYMKKLQKAL